ncbi:hypothetical protein FB472_0381 [Rhodoglobus vestalii]|uniref:ApeA N-terminal domain-containing protein n=1 Tax=Rhodoglobus vestalii TaxID=193384 RepID=A0A8H2K4K6_9MICO|nr:hypothetical protein [Rhodoglobus vestalii]TQO18854.1 hypothetical protein FB472_0381 [Rhodoglobus vestalii]
MALFSENFQWPSTSVLFESIGDGARDGTAEVVERGGRWILNSPSSFSYATGQPGIRVLTASLDGTPTLIRGTIFVIDGDLGLRVDELRVGSALDDAQYITVTGTFEHLASACSHRHEDGAARSPSQPLLFPAVDGAPQMEATLRSGENSITLVALEPVPLEAFETQLAVFQALLTFATDLPCGRLTLVATEASGQTVTVFGRDKYAPFERPRRTPVEHSLRFSGDWIQHAIERWWAAYCEWKPVLQILVGLRYQPGYVEADVILSSAAIDSVSEALKQHEAPQLTSDESLPILEALELLSGLNQAQKAAVAQLKGDLGRTTFRSRAEQLVRRVDDDTWQVARVSIEEWTRQLIKARNTIAHAVSSSIWEDDLSLRGIRDANWIVLTLVLLTHLGVPDPAINRAAERLGARYIARYRDLGIFS